MPCGACIGWTDGSDLYLDSSASYQVAQQAAGLDRFVASEQTLRRRLHGQGLLVSIDTGRQTLLVRKTLEGCPRHVLPSESQRSGGDDHGNRRESHAVAPESARPARGSQWGRTNNNTDDVGFVGFLRLTR